MNLVGTIVDGRYLIEAEVGRGGFGIVYRARHLRFDSTVALKVLFRDPDGLVPSEHPGGRGSEEGRLLFQLSALHPSIVRVFETGLVTQAQCPTLPYLAMEWLDGLTLKRHIDQLSAAQMRLELPNALHLLDEVAQALVVAHSHRITHRDVKPANVFLSLQAGRVVPKLVDFGLAKVGNNNEDAYDDSLLKEGPFTPAYAAPEQWDRSLGATGPWTDVYSFSLLLVELIVGRRWYPIGDRPGFARLALDPQQRPTPSSLGVSIDENIEKVLLRALAVTPRGRYASMSEFWEALCTAANWVRPHSPLDLRKLGLCPPDVPIPTPPTPIGNTLRTTLHSALSAALGSAMKSAISGSRPSNSAAASDVERPPSIQRAIRLGGAALAVVVLSTSLLGYALHTSSIRVAPEQSLPPKAGPLTGQSGTKAQALLPPALTVEGGPGEETPERIRDNESVPTAVSQLRHHTASNVRPRNDGPTRKTPTSLIAPNLPTGNTAAPCASVSTKPRTQPKDYLLDESLSTRQ